MNELLKIESLDVNKLPELQGMREKQLQIVKDNPFIEITDNKSFDEAKKARTTLVTARTEIQNQDKLIASKIQEFRKSVSAVSEELISITRPHEEKQQQEVKRWEKVKEEEKQEKLRLEEERKSKIKNTITNLIEEGLSKINKCSFETIDSLRVDFEEGLYKTDISQFDEFELDFNEKLILLKNSFSSRIKTLEETESQRLEKIRIAEESKKLEEAKAKQEADLKAEAERLQKIKDEQEAALNAEREKLAKEKAILQAELDAREYEAKKIRQAEEEKLRKEREAERLEALKPEKEKLLNYLEKLESAISEVEIPEIKETGLSNSQKLVNSELLKIITNFKEVIKNFK